jgi:hypothetical protein
MNQFQRVNAGLQTYGQIERTTAKDLQQIARQYAERPDPKLEQQFLNRLKTAQVQTYQNANEIARRKTPLTDRELTMLEARFDHQREFATKFFDDMRNGRGTMNYETRAGMYAESLWGLHNRGLLGDFHEPKHERYDWILDPFVEHCDDCIERARQSRREGGISYDELVVIGFPGDGMTRCGSRCRCRIQGRKRRRNPDGSLPKSAPAPESFEVGGVRIHREMPAAGLPFVEVEPSAIGRSLELLPADDAGLLLEHLPALPQILAKPAAVFDDPQVWGRQYYVDPRAVAVLDRDSESGIWKLAHFLLAKYLNLPEFAVNALTP